MLCDCQLAVPHPVPLQGNRQPGDPFPMFSLSFVCPQFPAGRSHTEWIIAYCLLKVNGIIFHRGSVIVVL